MAALTIFDRLNRERPQPTPTEPAREDQTTQLLEWIVKHWDQPTITARAIGKFGPTPLRNDTKRILNLTRALVETGWLIPVPTWRHDKREWKIARGLPLNK